MAYNQVLAVPPIDAFVRRAWHRVVIIGDYAYINGGEVAMSVTMLVNGVFSTGPSSAVANQTLSLDLSRPWTNTTTDLFHPIPRPAAKQGLDLETVWAAPDGSGYFAWGGAAAPTSPPAESPGPPLWKFTVDGGGGGTWDAVATAQNFSARVRTTAAAQSRGTGFALGGRLDGDGRPVSGLVAFDMASKAWRNESAVAFAPPGGTVDGGSLTFVSGFGGQGVLVPLGGYVPGAAGPVDATDGVPDTGYLVFSNISVFDVATEKWFWQAASGEVPEPRQGGCAVGLREPGEKSFEIFLYGGYNGLSENTHTDVAVLSLPGFVWSRRAFGERKERNGAARSFAACAVAGEASRQMLVVGGVYQSREKVDYWRSVDPWPQGLGVFDLTAMNWSSGWDPNAAEYERPQAVRDWYSQGKKADWSSDGVRDLFEPPTPSVSPPPESPGPSPTPPSPGLSGSAIGGIVGGILSAAILGLVAFIFWLWRRKAASTPAPTESEDRASVFPTSLPPRVRWPPTSEYHAELHDTQVEVQDRTRGGFCHD
ncbi:hypothetical protein B0H67DRAFT_120924 [Lasiosphaeris hirsuta]|uniref:Kelch repeat protein n=1 Tax=Lasiosphaeris hirsuta TaxID=260670 RepID=A0AA40AZW5_9PEZI|nr:hypothetical protein B0H67DRAFT_120924 [Lasiosphaeris hirsuta]